MDFERRQGRSLDEIAHEINNSLQLSPRQVLHEFGTSRGHLGRIQIVETTNFLARDRAYLIRTKNKTSAENRLTSLIQLVLKH